MTIGIYRLNFSSGAFYVGQSVNIESRYQQHCRRLRVSIKSNQKMLEEYKSSGLPAFEILKECSIEELSVQEAYYIDLFSATTYPGLNVLKHGQHLCGFDSPNAKYEKEQYEAILFMLIDTKCTSYDLVSKTLNVSYSTVERVVSGTGHAWLKEEYPEDFAVLEELRKKRLTHVTGKVKDKRPPLLSPEGLIYNLSGQNISAFCREHNLNRPHLTTVLNGKRKQSQGWRLSPII